MTCGKPCKVENADRVGNSDVVTFPDTIGYRCLGGYLIQGRTKLASQAAPLTVTCEAGGSFSGVEACPPVPRPAVNAKDHLFATYDTGAAGSRKYPPVSHRRLRRGLPNRQRQG